jgi:alcohol dehydrogenase (cytochrome c)
MVNDDHSSAELSRRKLLQIGGAAAIPVVGLAAVLRSDAQMGGMGQGTPGATPASTPQPVAVTGATPGATPAATPAAAGAAGDWATFGYDYGQTRHVPFTAITKDNVTDLGIAWQVDFQAIDETIPPANQSFPLVIDGVIYVTTTYSRVFALDAKTGDVKWRWQPDQIGFFKNFGVSANRGVAVGGGSVFVMTLDMHIYKLDQATGKLQQTLQISDVVTDAKSEFGYYESTAPIFYDGVLYFGVSGSDNGVRGFMMAVNGSDMSPAWPAPFWTIPPDGQDWRSQGANHGGGTPWMPGTIDTETGVLYFVSGNPSPDFFGAVRPGNNPNTNSMIAVNAKTGEQIWVAQSIARDVWDYDMAAPPVLFTAVIAGEERKVVAEGSKAAQWWCWDAATGEVIYDGIPFGQIDHPDPTPEGVLVYPGILGGSNYAPQSYDPTTNFYLVCNIEWPSVVSYADPAAVERRSRGDIDYGGTSIFSTDVAPYGTYVAIDLSTGNVVYSKETPGILRSGFTTTAAGLGFFGGTTYADSNIHCIETATGDLLWSFGVGNDVQSAPSIYEIDGEQYVAQVVGGTGSKLIAFKLGGDKTQLPAPPPPEQSTTPPPTDPNAFLQLSTKQPDTVIFNAIAGFNDANNGLNFNGYSKGDATITIPTNQGLAVNLWNNASLPHSLGIVTADQVTQSTDYVWAFQGSYTPNPINGFTGDQQQHFVSVQSPLPMAKPGKYAIICAVPGHTPAGMWLNLVVDDNATVATLSGPDGTLEAKPQPESSATPQAVNPEGTPQATPQSTPQP